MIAHHTEPPTLWPRGNSADLGTSNTDASPRASSAGLIYNGPMMPLMPKPVISSVESRSSSANSGTPPPPLVLGTAHLPQTSSSRPSSDSSGVPPRALTPQGRVEISIVGSPEVFGVGPNQESQVIANCIVF